MCGIFGILNLESTFSFKEKEVLAQAIITNSVRGLDSTGMLIVPKANKKEPKIIKKAVAGWDFVDFTKVKEDLVNYEQNLVMLIHNRAATKGTVSNKNAHPFNHGNIYLVHNGTLANSSQLTPSGMGLFDVDSDLITYLLSIHPYTEVLPKLKGSYVLIWYNSEEECLYVYRNEERPIYFSKVKDKNILFFASESMMLSWLANRNGVELEKILYPTAFKLLKFKNSIEYTTEVIEPEQEKVVIAKPPEHGVQYSISNLNTYYNSKTISKENFFKYVSSKGIRIGDILDFYFDEWEQPKRTSRHFTLKGELIKEGGIKIIANGLLKFDASRSDIFSGEMMGTIYRNGENYIVVKNILKKVTKDRVEDKLYCGPNSIKVSLKEFTALTKDGCSACQASIFPSDHDKLSWSDNNSPICINCQRIYNINQYWD
jgi:hypothetical protein